MDDKTLRQIVVDELTFEPSIDAASIGVAVDEGVVTLTGHVSSYSEKLRVEEAVRRVKGVKAIAQEIDIRYPAAKKTADDEIAKRAVDILRWDVEVPDEHIQIKVQNGWITLTGRVEWQFQKQAAEHAVRKLSGVHGVVNQIEIEPSAEPGDVRKHIEDALKRNAEVEAEAIQVTVEGSRVRLEGKVKAWRERQLADQAAWAAPGVRYVEDRLEVG